MTITIDQLHAYLKRREEETRAFVNRQRSEAHNADRDTREGRHTWDVYVIGNARANLYRELLEALETGKLPK